VTLLGFFLTKVIANSQSPTESCLEGVNRQLNIKIN
jgi:hypothetical protein